MNPLVDPVLMLWASVYVMLKWTVGVWALRRVKASLVVGPTLLRGTSDTRTAVRSGRCS